MSFADRPREVWWRRALFQAHRWLGLTVGILTAVIGLTGASIVFRTELNDWTAPGSLDVTPLARRLPADELLARVMAHHEGSHALVSIFFENGPARAWNFRTVSGEGERWHTWIDPYTGRVIGAESYQGKLLQWLFDLHAEWLAGKTGRTVNGFFAVGLMAMAVTGLVVWWPGRKNWRFGFVFERRARWRRKVYDLHKLAGFWSSLMLLMLAFTGAWFSFQDFYMDVLGAPKPPRARTRIGNRRAPLDEFIMRAEALMPGARAVTLTIPASRGEALTVRLKEPTDWHRLGQNYAFFEPATGQLLRSDRLHEQALGTRFARLLTPFHFGRFGERFGVGMWPVWVSLVCYVGFGLMPALLLVTGALMFWGRGRTTARDGA